MKRYIAIFSILVVFMTMLVGCNSSDFDPNRVGKDQYYVQSDVDGKEVEAKAEDGKRYTRYEYELAGFDENGKEKVMEFDASKNLRKEAFLRVYHNGKGVLAWEEVKKDKLPKKVKEKLSVK
ncbi:YxeA family protein [Bacillus manliponensis]|uniref:YxeA family protein n=1 Tax=Bacillus manliponensis TaxID=574376 RepID=UPI0035135DFC